MTRILIAEDNADLRTILKSGLETFGYAVAGAANGRTAMKLLRAVSVDLVITDIFMPEMDGIETIAAIRAEFPGMPIIAMSGGSSIGWVDYLSTARELGAARCLRKPFELHQLIAAVLDLVPPRGIRRAEREGGNERGHLPAQKPGSGAPEHP